MTSFYEHEHSEDGNHKEGVGTSSKKGMHNKQGVEICGLPSATTKEICWKKSENVLQLLHFFGLLNCSVKVFLQSAISNLTPGKVIY